MLLPLAATTLATAAAVLVSLLQLAPEPPLALAAALSGCTKALAQSLSIAEALLASLQAAQCADVARAPPHGRAAAAEEAALAHQSALIGALVAALHRCALTVTHGHYGHSAITVPLDRRRILASMRLAVCR